MIVVHVVSDDRSNAVCRAGLELAETGSHVTFVRMILGNQLLVNFSRIQCQIHQSQHTHTSYSYAARYDALTQEQVCSV
jgi:hypothetical protein